MTLTIATLDVSTNNTNYFSTGFRNCIEDHLEYLRNHAYTQTQTVLPMQAMKYRGDLYGLLSDVGIPDEHHWITMRINGMHSTQDYTGDLLEILVPDVNILTALLQRYISK